MSESTASVGRWQVDRSCQIDADMRLASGVGLLLGSCERRRCSANSEDRTLAWFWPGVVGKGRRIGQEGGRVIGRGRGSRSALVKSSSRKASPPAGCSSSSFPASPLPPVFSSISPPSPPFCIPSCLHKVGHVPRVSSAGLHSVALRPRVPRV